MYHDKASVLQALRRELTILMRLTLEMHEASRFKRWLARRVIGTQREDVSDVLMYLNDNYDLAPEDFPAVIAAAAYAMTPEDTATACIVARKALSSTYGVTDPHVILKADALLMRIGDEELDLARISELLDNSDREGALMAISALLTKPDVGAREVQEIRDETWRQIEGHWKFRALYYLLVGPAPASGTA